MACQWLRVSDWHNPMALIKIVFILLQSEPWVTHHNHSLNYFQCLRFVLVDYVSLSFPFLISLCIWTWPFGVRFWGGKGDVDGRESEALIHTVLRSAQATLPPTVNTNIRCFFRELVKSASHDLTALFRYKSPIL